MSTRSHIGYVNDDGSVVAVYCHFDGYPEETLSNLMAFVTERGIEALVDEVDRGVREAGIRSFHAGGAETYGDFRGEKSEGDEWKTTDRADLNHDYAYIFSRKTGELTEGYQYGTKISTAKLLQDAGW